MAAEFSFDVDSARNLIRLRMAGFFTPADLARFTAAQDAAHRQLTCARNQHSTINDVRALSIQSQDIVQGFRDLLADPRYWSRRLAFIVGPTLTRGQLLRAINTRTARCFTDPAEAEAWVLARDDDDTLAA